MAAVLERQIKLKQISSDTYTTDWDDEWLVGATLWAGPVFAMLYKAAATHLKTEPKLSSRKQPDILCLHAEIINPCEPQISNIIITTLRTGAMSCTLQLQLIQNNKTRVIAFVTSTNFDQSIGPTAQVKWSLQPPPQPIPSFDCILAQKQEENWVASRLDSEIIRFANRLLSLTPRSGNPDAGICDAWNTIRGSDHIDAPCLALMCDFIPSMSDTLSGSGLFDAHERCETALQHDKKQPGAHAVLAKTMSDVLKSQTFNSAINVSIDFKQRLPDEGLQWLFTRTSAKMMRDGRMDVAALLCNERLELLCEMRQSILVLDTARKFHVSKEKAVL